MDPGAAEEKWLPVGNIKAEWDNQRDVLPSLLYLSLLSCFVFFFLAPSTSPSSECHVSQSAKSLSLLSDVLLMRCSNAALFPSPHFFFHCITPSLCKKKKKRAGVRTSLLDECAVFGDEVAERRGRGWKGEKKNKLTEVRQGRIDMWCPLFRPPSVQYNVFPEASMFPLTQFSHCCYAWLMPNFWLCFMSPKTALFWNMYHRSTI